MPFANSRYSFLSSVSEDALEQDESIKMLAPYFDKAARAECKVKHATDGTLSWEYNNTKVKDGSYLYAVGMRGQLYLAQCTIHSQIKAARRIQSAGHISIKDGIISCVDNYSGHYRPSLSAFLLSVHGLIEEGYLSPRFSMKINSLTTVDNLEADRALQELKGKTCEVTFLKERQVYLLSSESHKAELSVNVIKSVLIVPITEEQKTPTLGK